MHDIFVHIKRVFRVETRGNRFNRMQKCRRRRQLATKKRQAMTKVPRCFMHCSTANRHKNETIQIIKTIICIQIIYFKHSLDERFPALFGF